jgi:hypothetical protein
MEPAPPTYEEALSLFVRDSNGASGGGAHKVDRPVRPAGSRRNTASGAEEDREMAERLQREEFEQYATRERSATARGSQAEGDRDDRADASRSEASDSSSAPPDPADTSRSSDSSLPTVDFSRVHRNLLPLYGQRRPPPPIPGLRTIPENEDMTIDPSPDPSDSDSCGKACCYYSCFGFAVFTHRLSRPLRDAWRSGVENVTEMSLPVFSTQVRYILFLIQALVTLACIMTSFATTSFKDENLVRSVCLVACFVVNILERIFSCGCCHVKRKTYNAYSDITRNVLTDIFLYPAVIASIMNALNTKSYNVVFSLWDSSIYANVSNVSSTNKAVREDAVNFSMNALVLLLFVVMVHVVRLGQLGAIVKSLVGNFKEDVSGARSTSRAFIIIFFVHVLIQSIVQGLYLFLIGFRFRAELNHPSQPQILGISVYLLTMMVCGELVPLLGVSMYFITAQKWAEEFPIALLLDNIPSQRSLSGTAHDRVEHQFKALHKFNTKCLGCFFGLLHPLLSPLQILVSAVYFALWLLFVCSYPINNIDATNLDLSLSGNASPGVLGTVGIAVVYGLLVLLSLFGNLLPLIYGFVGLAVFPFWGLFYICVGCASLCRNRS